MFIWVGIIDASGVRHRVRMLGFCGKCCAHRMVQVVSKGNETAVRLAGAVLAGDSAEHSLCRINQGCHLIARRSYLVALRANDKLTVYNDTTPLYGHVS